MKRLRWILPVAAAVLLTVFLLARPSGERGFTPAESGPGDAAVGAEPLSGGTSTPEATLLRGPATAAPDRRATAAEETDSLGVVHGTVRSESGEAVEAAVVLFMRVMAPGTLVYEAMERGATRAISDANGAYRSPLAPGLYIVRARKDDRASRRQEVQVPCRGPLDLEVVPADASITIRFQARNPDVDLHALALKVIANQGRVQPRNLRGEVLITGLHVGDVVSLHVALEVKDQALAILAPPGSGREYLTGGRIMQTVVAVGGPSTVQVFRVGRLARIHGRLLSGAGGAPRARYTIACRQQGSGWAPQGKSDTSNPIPTYSVWVLPERPTALFAQTMPVVAPVIATEQPVRVGPLDFGEETQIDLHLTPADHTVRGQIVDVDGRPLRRVGVRVIQRVAAGLADAEASSPFIVIVNGGTEPEGTFELEGLLATESVLDVSPPTDARGTKPLPIAITDWWQGHVSMGTITLPRGGNIIGTLEVPPGQESSSSSSRKIAVRIVPSRPDGRPHTSRLHHVTVEHHDGAGFTVENLAPGTYRLLRPGPLRQAWQTPLGEVQVEAGETSTITVSVAAP